MAGIGIIGMAQRSEDPNLLFGSTSISVPHIAGIMALKFEKSESVWLSKKHIRKCYE